VIVEEIPAALAGERIDRVVALVTQASRSEAAGLIEAGAVTVDGLPPASGKVRVREGQRVVVDETQLPVAPRPAADPTRTPVEVARPAVWYGGVQTSTGRASCGLTHSGWSWLTQSAAAASPSLSASPSAPASASAGPAGGLAASSGACSGGSCVASASSGSGGSCVATAPPGSAGSSAATAPPGSGSAEATSSPALSAWSSGGIGTYFFLASAGRNHRPDSPIAGAASGPGAPSVTVPFAATAASASPSGPAIPGPAISGPSPASPSHGSAPS